MAHYVVELEMWRRVQKLDIGKDDWQYERVNIRQQMVKDTIIVPESLLKQTPLPAAAVAPNTTYVMLCCIIYVMLCFVICK